MKKILISIVLLSLFSSFMNNNRKQHDEYGRLSGVVTVRNPYGSVKQADPGCELFAIAAADIRSAGSEDLTQVIEKFQRDKYEYSMSVNSTTDPVRIINEQNNFDAISISAAKYISRLKKWPSVIRATADGTGNYALDLKPGKYYILAVSRGVRSNNPLEANGNIDISTTDVKTSRVTLLNFNFEESDNVRIILLTGWRRQGC